MEDDGGRQAMGLISLVFTVSMPHGDHEVEPEYQSFR